MLTFWTFSSVEKAKTYENAIVVDFSDLKVVSEKSTKTSKKKESIKTSKPKTKSEPKKKAVKTVKPSSQKPKASPKPVIDTDALAKEKARLLAEQAAIEASEKAKKEEERLAAEEKAKNVSHFKSLFEKSQKISEAKKKQNQKKINESSTTADQPVSSNQPSNIEGAIGTRRVLKVPSIKDNSQKEGKVVVKICVDGSGKVISSKYTQIGSTTTDSYLIKLAEEGALEYQFSESTIEKQCGRVIIEFALRA